VANDTILVALSDRHLLAKVPKVKLAEQIAGLPHAGVIFRPLSPPLRRRESTIAWRADNPSKPLKDYIQIVKELSYSM
jgi:hypothetical protein